jgi:hypothetical protein
MATRMQQRRGTAAQWTAANPVLAAGEIGFETDTNKFKMGNGSSAWSALTYFANAAELAAIIDGAPGLLNTLNELAEAMGDDPDFLAALATNARVDTIVLNGAAALTDASNTIFSALSTHSADTTAVHGIADTAALATKSYADTAVSTHNSDTTDVHGIADTSLLATLSGVSTAKQEAIDAAIDGAGDITDAKITDYNTRTLNVHGIMDTEELALQADISAHNSETLNVHGISNTANLALQSDVSDAISSHHAETLNVHGIANTALLATTANVATAKGEAIDAAATASELYTDAAVTALTKASVGLTNVDNTADVDKPVSTAQATAIGTAKTEAIADAGTAADTKVSDHNLETTNVHGIADTADLVTQLDLSNAITGVTVDQSALAGVGIDWNVDDEQFEIDSTVATKTYADSAVSTHNNATTSVHGISNTAQLAYKNAANQTFTGNMEIDGNLVVDGDITVNGGSFNASATSIVIEDNMVQLAHQNAANTVDLGIVVGYNDGAAKHAGLVRDVSDAKWKLFKGVTTEPSTTVDFTQGSLDDLKVAAFEATTVTPSSGIVFSDGTQTKVGVPSITTFATAISSNATLAAGEADKFVPLTGAVTITLPATGYSTGQSIDFYQASGTGAQFSDANGVVGTPGRKFRTTNSVVTAMKTDSGWLIFGDLAV